MRKTKWKANPDMTMKILKEELNNE
jgi:Asp-tRNA(Asn)/Glu-tRNA(Gln) amidotransferase B subunit